MSLKLGGNFFVENQFYFHNQTVFFSRVSYKLNVFSAKSYKLSVFLVKSFALVHSLILGLDIFESL